MTTPLPTMSSPTVTSPNHHHVVETYHKKQSPHRQDALKLIKLKVREGNEAKRKARGGMTLLKDGMLTDDLDQDDHPTSMDMETDGMKIINATAQYLQNIEWERRSPVKKVLVSEKLEKKLVVIGEETEEGEIVDEVPIDEEFIAGTVVFYRSILSLQQAKHKGFLTYEWVEEPAEDHTIAAFERKISIDAVSKITNPISTHFEILNTASLYDESSVKYGDVVYLVVAEKGRYVLGSQYNGLVNAFGHRSLNPGILKCSLRGNIAEMTIQQYSTSIERTDAGRWIILNKDDPIGKHGTVVRHGDRIMLEQEFYYLSSSSPTQVALERTRWSLEDVWKRNPDLDFFGMTEECCWLTHLVHQKNLGTTDTRKGAVMQLRAVHQLDSSMGARSQARRSLFGRMNELVDSSTEFDHVQQNLQHKMNEKSDKQHLLELYSTMSRKMFQRYYRSMSANQLAASSSRWHSKPPEVQEVAQTTTEAGQDELQENIDDVDPNDPLHDNGSTAIDFESISVVPSPNHTEMNFFGDSQNVLNEFEKDNVVMATMTKNISVHFTPLPTITVGRSSPTRRRRSRKEILTPAQQHEQELNNMQAEYWQQAQQLRVSSSAWEELPAIKKYQDGPRERARLKAAILIQRFVRRKVNFSGIYRRSMRNADSRMYMRLAMMKKMDWREEFMQTLATRRKHETEQQKKRDLESSYFFATAATEKSAVDESSSSTDIDGGAHAASNGIDAVISSPVHLDQEGGDAAENHDENMDIEERANSPIPPDGKNIPVDNGSQAMSSSPVIAVRQSKGRRERTLHDVSKLGKLTSVQAFVTKKVDVNEFDRHGVTPIFYAVAKGHLEVARYLVHHGADTATRSKRDGYTLLYIACIVGHLPLVKYLLNECHADKNETVRNGATPMTAAIEAGHDAVANYLQNYDTDRINTNIADRSQPSSLLRNQQPEVHFNNNIALTVTEKVVELSSRSHNQYVPISHSEHDLTLTAHRPATASERARQPVFMAPYLFPYPVDKNGNRRPLDNLAMSRPQTSTPLFSEKRLETEEERKYNAVRKKKAREQRKLDLANAAKKALGVRSDNNTLGLPADVFENLQLKTSTGTGINFLRVMSSTVIDSEQPPLSKSRHNNRRR